MPFLLDYISKIPHESAFNTLTRVQKSKETIPLPYEVMQESMKSAHDVLRRGDWIDFYGPSGSGKTVIMLDIAKHSLNTSLGHIIYIDLDDRAHPIDNDRFHLFKRGNIKSLCGMLESWLDEHVEIDVRWVMVDNTSPIDSKGWEGLKGLKDKWGFVLLTSTREHSMENGQYRFEMSIGDKIQMQLVWPTPKSLFSVDL